MHYMAILDWLVANNLFKATVAFFVTLTLGALLGVVLRPWKAWKAHKRTQERIADSLDTTTPGGLTELVHRLDRLLQDEVQREEDEDEGDDNGSDRIEAHGGKMTPGHSVIPDIIHGGGSAGHR